MITVIQILVAILTVICIAIFSILLAAFITGWVESKNRKADLSKVDFLKLNRAYQKHVVAASRCKDEINKRLSAMPTKSDGGIGNYRQEMERASEPKNRKPHIATRKVERKTSTEV